MWLASGWLARLGAGSCEGVAHDRCSCARLTLARTEWLGVASQSSWGPTWTEQEMHVSTANLLDERGAEFDSCELQLHEYGGRVRCEGSVRTVRCLEDFELVRRVLAEPGRGMVLVIDGGGSFRSALLGDRLAGGGARNGWAGLVIAGAVRDVGALAGVDISIKALGSSPRRSAADGVGEIDVAVTLGSATFTPGEYLWSDEDGVIVTRADSRRYRVLPEATGILTQSEVARSSARSTDLDRGGSPGPVTRVQGMSVFWPGS